MISALFDACVLYSASLRDFLLRLSFDGLIFPFWSEKIQNEWIRNLLRNRPDLKRENLERTCREMDFHFPNSLVRGYEPILPTLQLPDPDDRHVLAAAIYAKAKYIVTFNLGDFPESALAFHQVEAIFPDDFVLRVIGCTPVPFLAAIAKHRAILARPPKTVDEYLATLKRRGLPKTVAFLQEHHADL